jgi:chromosome segregation ATPase
MDEKISESSERCAECGHERKYFDAKTFKYGDGSYGCSFGQGYNDACGCKCVFPATEQAGDGSMTEAQLNRASLIAESRGIELEVAQEVVYLRDEVSRLRSKVERWKTSLREQCHTTMEIMDQRDAAERKLTTARADAIGEALDAISDLRKAYPENVFTPIADGEAGKVHEQYPGLVDRISAQMARHLLDRLTKNFEQLNESS